MSEVVVGWSRIAREGLFGCDVIVLESREHQAQTDVVVGHGV